MFIESVTGERRLEVKPILIFDLIVRNKGEGEDYVLKIKNTGRGRGVGGRWGETLEKLSKVLMLYTNYVGYIYNNLFTVHTVIKTELEANASKSIKIWILLYSQNKVHIKSQVNLE